MEALGNLKAICLFSGGLDSVLATKLMIEQGVEVLAVNFKTPFTSSGWAEEMAEVLGVELRVVEVKEDYMNMVRNPEFGYGKNMNPCIDCKIFMLRKAKEVMEAEGFCFVFTGEVLGERPMSQGRRQLDMIEKKSGLGGRLLRPMSAKLLEPTVPELENTVDRSGFFAIKGRSRKTQLELARSLGLKRFATPAGGCLLTDPNFSARLRESFDHGEYETEILRYGRHFRTRDGDKVVVGRNKRENEILEKLAGEDYFVIEVKNFPGPIVLVKQRSAIEVAVSLALRYSDCESECATMCMKKGDNEWETEGKGGLSAMMVIA